VNAPALPGFLGSLASLLDHYGYLAVAALVLVEDFGVPAPGETVLIAAAIYSGAGQLNVALVALIGFVSAVAGDNIGFLIGRVGGRPLALRYGRFVLLTPERLDKAESWFKRHGGKVVAVARFVEGLRQANGIIAGITGLRWRRFLAFNALGAALWVGLWVTLGDVAGTHIAGIYDTAHRYELYLIAAVGALLVALTTRYALRRRARANGRRVAHDGRSDEAANDLAESHDDPGVCDHLRARDRREKKTCSSPARRPSPREP
jgi:membrane protein DedA with SNARE-associated domain